VLAGPITAKPDARSEAVNLTLRTPGWYKVTSIQFRDETIPETETVVYWRVPEEKEDEEYRNWYTTGIAACADFSTLAEQRQDDGTYLLRFGNEKDGLPALAVFQHDRLTLYVSLKSEEEPDYASPNCVCVEMKKVADIPPEEPMIPITEWNAQANAAEAGETNDDTSGWMQYARLAAIATAGGAIVLALIISVSKKRRG